MASSASHVPVSAAESSFWAQESPDPAAIGFDAALEASSSGHNSFSEPSQGPTPPRSTNTSEKGSAPRVSVPVACVACRSRHLKCDGGVRCSRCRADGVECSYIKSRRGWKGKRRTKAPGTDNSSAPTPGPENGSLLSSPLDGVLGSDALQLTSQNFEFNLTSTPPNGLNFLATTPQNQLALTGVQRQTQPVSLGPGNSTGAFFAFFNGCHPFLLPRNRLVELLKERRIPHLELAIQFIGSCFIPSAPTDMYKQALNQMLSQQSLDKNGFSVQTLMLFAMGLHANNDPGRAAQIILMAIQLALEIGLHRSDFAIIHGNGDRVLEECWKRTWWSLYIVNGMFAAVNPTIPFQLRDVATDVLLPCEDTEYISGQIPFSRSIQEYDDEPFSEERVIFSSFTYLIDAVRILGRVFEACRADPFEYHIVDDADDYLTNWPRLLPETKKNIVRNDGHVDELLFTARMIISGSTIMLHRPRSNLGYGDAKEITTCVDPLQLLSPTQSRETHTAKCLAAAEDISKLIKLPGSLQRHTPFFTCVIVMSSVVHLSYWSFLVPDGQDEKIKSSIRLDIGALQTLTNLWPVAKTVLGQVRGVAHVMYRSKKAQSLHMWTTIANDEIIRGVIEDGALEDPQTYAPLLPPSLQLLTP